MLHLVKSIFTNTHDFAVKEKKKILQKEVVKIIEAINTLSNIASLCEEPVPDRSPLVYIYQGYHPFLGTLKLWYDSKCNQLICARVKGDAHDRA